MSDATRAKAVAALQDAEAVTSALLPVPVQAEQLPDPAAAEVEVRVAELDMADTQTIIRFGTAAQSELQAISQQMLSGVRNKDVGPASNSLREMVSTIRGFSTEELDPNRKQSWWERFVGWARPMGNFMAKFGQVQTPTDNITDELLNHGTVLLKDIRSLDQLYAKTPDFYDELALYIAAGKAKLDQLDTSIIPAKPAEVDATPESD